MKQIKSPAQFRLLCRKDSVTFPTAGILPNYVQCNLVILPQKYAYDFLLFCQRNPKPCPLLEVTEVGNPLTKYIAKDADLRTDIPKYRIYRYGQYAGEVLNVKALWKNNFVGFLLGCSFSFEAALISAGLSVRHIEEQVNVPMYKTNIKCLPAGPFQGNMVVTMRPYTPSEIPQAVQITARYPRVHGTPVHIGDPSQIGIMDINKPDYGSKVHIRKGEIPVFWGCGVTPQNIILNAKPDIAITHAPGHMLIADILNDQLSLS